MTVRWYALDINPEPWAIGAVSVGRKNGKVFPIVGRNEQLNAFQEAVREQMTKDGYPAQIVGHVRMTFYFWRTRSSYTTPSSRAHRKHEADATNMQKALEDALQGILYHNDKDVWDIRSVIVEQGPEVLPKIVVKIEELDGFNPDELPAWVWEEIEMALIQPSLFDAQAEYAKDDEVF